MVSRVVLSAKSLPGKGFSVTSNEITDITDATQQPLMTQEVIALVNEEQQPGTSTTCTDPDEEWPFPRLSITELTKFLSAIYAAQDHLTEIDPNFTQAELVKTILERAKVPYKKQ